MENTLPPSGADQVADGQDGDRVPGVVVVFAGGAPAARVIPLGVGPVELGRDGGGGGGAGGGAGSTKPGKLDDGRVSGRHALITYHGARCLITDLGSRNGTLVDGERIAPHLPTPVQRVIRVGDTLLVPYADVRPFERAGVTTVDDFVRGPEMQAVLDQAARAAHAGTTLHIRGESGSGKEGVALAFHRASARGARPPVSVNCAAIPHGLAERLLFGAKRGAYSGAETDAPGYIQEAEGSTLFLDEIAELDLQVQAKLLRVLESREVLPLGASKPRKVDFALCSATNKDLRALVAAGGMREDLYFRIGRPSVALPALRRRPEEIPVLIAQQLARLPAAPAAHVSLVEQCLLRPWPGNIRELLAEVRSAAHTALCDGNRVEARHLAASAGTVFGAAMPGTAAAMPPAPPAPVEWPRKRTPRVDDDYLRRVHDALRANGGNVTGTARALGLHRTQLRRLLERHGIAIDAAANPESDPGDAADAGDSGDSGADDRSGE